LLDDDVGGGEATLGPSVAVVVVDLDDHGRAQGVEDVGGLEAGELHDRCGLGRGGRGLGRRRRRRLGGRRRGLLAVVATTRGGDQGEGQEGGDGRGGATQGTAGGQLVRAPGASRCARRGVRGRCRAARLLRGTG